MGVVLCDAGEQSCEVGVVVGVGVWSIAVVEGAQSLWVKGVGGSGAVGYGAQSVCVGFGAWSVAVVEGAQSLWANVVAWSGAVDEVAQTLAGSGWVVV